MCFMKYICVYEISGNFKVGAPHFTVIALHLPQEPILVSAFLCLAMEVLDQNLFFCGYATTSEQRPCLAQICFQIVAS